MPGGGEPQDRQTTDLVDRCPDESEEGVLTASVRRVTDSCLVPPQFPSESSLTDFYVSNSLSPKAGS